MLTTKEAIENRRSIRKFKPDPIPDEYLKELLNSARLAPSGCNAQPWRFKIVKDDSIKAGLAEAAHDQAFISRAPAVIVCCADIKGYLEGTVSGAQDLEETGAIENRVASILKDKIKDPGTIGSSELGARLAVNVAIAIEHIVLRALDFGLGSCWVRLIDEGKIRELFGWDDNIYVVALLPIGYPAEFPEGRKKRGVDEILID